MNRKKKEREELEEALNARVRTADSDFYNDKGIIVFFWSKIEPFIHIKIMNIPTSFGFK